MRRDLLLIGLLLLTGSIIFTSYSASNGFLTVYKVEGSKFVPVTLKYIDRGVRYDVHQDPPYNNYDYYHYFSAHQIGDKIWYNAAYKGYFCFGDLYIHYILGGDLTTRPARTGDLGYSHIGGVTAGYSISNNCQWHDQYVGWHSYPVLSVGNGKFDFPFKYVEYQARPVNPVDNRPTWDVCWSLESGSDSPFWCARGHDYTTVDFRGWFYDFVNHKYGIAFYIGRSLDSYPGSGYFVRIGSSAPIKVPVVTEGPCGIASYYDGSHRYLIEHVSSDGNLYYTDWPVAGSGVFYFDSDFNKWVCLTSDGYEIYPGSNGWERVKKFDRVPASYFGWRFGSVPFNEGNIILWYFRTTPSDFYYFRDSDGDHVPDIWKLSGYYDYRYEIDPVQYVRVKWLTLPSVPRTTNEADLNFTLDIGLWPGASVTFEDFRVSVDGHDLNASPEANYTYHFTYGDHQICYAFTLRNGDDVDPYNGCFDVHIGYVPWDVGFTYRQEGKKVTLIAHANDDGKIVSYEWNIDGTPYEENVPALTLELSPGDHDVCLTVVDNDGIKVQSCGTVTVSSVGVPSGARVVVNTRTRVIPVYEEAPVSVPAGVSPLSVAGIPFRMLLGGLGILLILVGVVL